MKIFKLFRRRAPKRKILYDFYQNSIEKTGRDQFKKMVEKGLNIPIVAL